MSQTLAPFHVKQQQVVSELPLPQPKSFIHSFIHCVQGRWIKVAEFSSLNTVLRGWRIKSDSVPCLAVVNKFLTYGGVIQKKKKYNHWKGKRKRNLKVETWRNMLQKYCGKWAVLAVSCALWHLKHISLLLQKHPDSVSHRFQRQYFTASLVVQNKWGRVSLN